ncbi:MAG TPA: vWA domain-containing protein [Polyangiaceae bacterium]|nr:vWA domain-containing protein [Polyangiaceae bacterium]
MTSGNAKGFRGGWSALAALVVALGCTSGQNEGGSNTNWWKCSVDQDCPSHERCVAERCTSVDASGSSSGPLEIDATSRDSGLCVGDAYRAEMEPVALSAIDVYLMVDQSSSMGDVVTDGGGSAWGALETGLSAFVGDPRAAGMSVGIQYFPLAGEAPASCGADYATPEVDLGALPGNADALTQSIGKHSPFGFTPTGPALTGALGHMKTWATSHPDRVPVVVLVTDGFATECAPQQIADIAAVARTAATTEPRVRTFVVGLNLGANGENLDTIAAAGGTGAAVLMTSLSLPTALSSAMLSISVSPLKCVFELARLADGGAFDPSLVSLRRIPKTGGAATDVPSVASVDECAARGGQGFYFDPPAAPTRVVTCPGTCAESDTNTLELRVHCPPTRPPASR